MWLDKYLIPKHGKVPYCEICGRKLRWPSIERKSNDVVFDHKSDKVIIAHATSWLLSKQPTPENINVFDLCDFGILCNTCNHYLPTKDRFKWFANALKYVWNTKTEPYKAFNLLCKKEEISAIKGIKKLMYQAIKHGHATAD